MPDNTKKARKGQCDRRGCDNKLTAQQKRFCSQDCYHKQQSIEARQRGNKTGPESMSVELLKELSPEEEKFCRLYATDKECFGNGTKAALHAFDTYDPDDTSDYRAAANRAHNLLKKSKITRGINEALEHRGLNDEFIDKQLLFLISQHEDYSTKLKAIKEYNRLMERIEGKSGDRDIYNFFETVHQQADEIEKQKAQDADVIEEST